MSRSPLGHMTPSRFQRCESNAEITSKLLAKKLHPIRESPDLEREELLLPSSLSGVGSFSEPLNSKQVDSVLHPAEAENILCNRGTSSSSFGSGGWQRNRLGSARQSCTKATTSTADWIRAFVILLLVSLVSITTIITYSLIIIDEAFESSKGTFFHISDIHLDPQYKSNGSPKHLCRSPINSSSSHTLGQYGCDSPTSLLASTLRQMAKASHTPDFIVVTGDIISYNFSTDEATLSALRLADQGISSVFRHSSSRILYCIGESEIPLVHRTGNKGRAMNEAWLQKLASVWEPHLRNAGPLAFQTFTKGGYYTALITANQKLTPSVGPSNMAVLVMNTVLLSSANPLLDSSPNYDPLGQFSWLEEQLREARNWGRKVIIAGHMPPGVRGFGQGPLWHAVFENRFVDIVLSNADVIVGQLFGHLHRDQFRLVHENAVQLSLKSAAEIPSSRGAESEMTETSLRALGGSSAVFGGLRKVLSRLGLVGRKEPWLSGDPPSPLSGSAILMVPSVSPALGNRPSFRLFKYDRWRTLIDYEEHTADLNESDPSKVWRVQYRSQSMYGLPFLNLETLRDLSSSFFHSSGRPTEKFFEFCRLREAGRDKNSIWAKESAECCHDCPRHIHCSLQSPTFEKYVVCRRKQHQFDQ